MLTSGRTERCTWPEVLRRYLLLTRSNTPVRDEDLVDRRYSLLPDDAMAVHAALELGRTPYWQLPPSFHLRLLHTLCDDAVSCFHMRSEIQSRMDQATELANKKSHDEAEVRST
jgi:hypothetical protein